MRIKNLKSLGRRLRNRFRIFLVYIPYFFQYQKYANLGGTPRTEKELDFKLRFLIHKLEKGMAFKNTKCPFGVQVTKDILNLIKTQKPTTHTKNQINDILNTYQKYLLEKCQHKISVLDNYLEVNNPLYAKREYLAQPYKETTTTNHIDLEQFKSFFDKRISVRDYDKDWSHLDFERLKKSIEITKKTPSVCNRQPWKIVIVKNEAVIKKLLQHQNGNLGFSNIKVLAIVIADLTAYVDDKEVYQPFFDTGMLGMSLLLSIHAAGFAACPLNLCTSHKDQNAIIKLLNLPKNYRATLMVSIGKPDNDKYVGCISPQQNSIIQEIL